MCRKNPRRESPVERAERLARRLDAVAVRLARGRHAIDVALGEVFLRLSAGELLLDLEAAKTTDFANELGIKPRDYFTLMKLARGLRERPILKQAVLAGEVSTVKALIVMDVAVGDAETTWTARAMDSTVADLKDLVRGSGGGDSLDTWGFETLRLDMTPKQQDRLAYALHLAKEITSYAAAPWKLWDEVAEDWLVCRQREQVDPPDPQDGTTVPATLEELRDRKNEIRRQLEAHLEACDFATEVAPPDENAFGLLALAKRLLARRKSFDVPLGRVLLEMASYESWRRLGYGSLDLYCQEQLGISGSTARERIRLEARMRELPQLREALKTGKLTYTKAVEVARHATPQDVEQRIAEAASTTHQQTKRDADAEEDRKDRARGRKKLVGPKAALDRVREAVRSARQFFAVAGEYLEPGEAWSRVVEHFIERWEAPLHRAEWRTRWKKEVMLRHGGLCAVPGCTRAARDIHHIVFREHGGPDEPWNCVALCWAHHKRCVHGGRLVVRGRGGEHLLWVMKGRELFPWQEWETRGTDRVHLRPFPLDRAG